MALHIEIRETASCVYQFDLNGSIDNESYIDLEKRFHSIMDGKAKGIYVNMRRVDYVSSAGMGVLVSVWKLLQKNKVSFVLVGLQPMVKKVFDLMRLSALFTILDQTPAEGETLDPADSHAAEKS